MLTSSRAVSLRAHRPELPLRLPGYAWNESEACGSGSLARIRLFYHNVKTSSRKSETLRGVGVSNRALHLLALEGFLPANINSLPLAHPLLVFRFSLGVSSTAFAMRAGSHPRMVCRAVRNLGMNARLGIDQR